MELQKEYKKNDVEQDRITTLECFQKCFGEFRIELRVGFHNKLFMKQTTFRMRCDPWKAHPASFPMIPLANDA